MNINPIAFEIGPFSVRWYGLLIAGAILLGTVIALREVRRKNIDEDDFLNIIIYGTLIGFLFARIYYVIFNWNYYSQFPGEIPAIWHGGLAIHGGLIGAVLTGIVYTRIKDISFWQIADIVAPSLILGQAIGRWGNFFNQEAYGYEVSPDKVPWAMFIDGAYRHPTFLYESIWNFSIFVLLVLIRNKEWVKRGEVFLGYLALYSAGRVIIEGFRTDSLMLGPLRVAQVMSLLLILGAVALMWWRRRGANS